MTKFTRLVLYFFILLTGCDSTDHSPKYLIHLHHLGDANAIMPVVEAMDPKDYKLILTGNAAQKYKGHENVLKIEGQVDQMTPHDIFSSDQLKVILKAAPFKAFVNGMAAKSQAQLNNIFRAKGIKTVSYYDNFDPPFPQGCDGSYITPFLNEYDPKGQPTIVALSTEALRPYFEKIDKFCGAPIESVGQPTLEEWDKFYTNFDEDKRTDLKEKLAIHQGQKVIVFAGGFDPIFENEYQQQLDKFFEALVCMPDVKVLVTYHPKTSGEIERAAINKANHPGAVVIEKGTYSTQQLSTIADMVATYKSSIGAQALYKGKPVVYIAEPCYENIFVSQGLATHAPTIAEIKAALQKEGQLRAKDINQYLIKNPTQVFKDFLMQ